MPPSAADGCSDDEGDDGSGTGNERRGLPFVRELLFGDDGLLLVADEALLIFGDLLLLSELLLGLGELLFSVFPSVFFRRQHGGTAHMPLG